MAKSISWNFERLKNLDFQKPDPDKYDISEELSAALRVAVALNQPLLITGKAGTGKTQLAHKAAAEFSRIDPTFDSTLIEYHTKSTSVAKDLLYSYDAVRHFHDVGVRNAEQLSPPKAVDYIELQALGRAILLSHPDAERGVFQGKLASKEARSSVVLIDEIDKAPRDFPNDLLHEINRYAFEVPEIGGAVAFERNPARRVVVILTSNSEKNLPEAFLRRCVYYHIPEPGEERLKEILAMHFEAELRGNEVAQQFLIDRFLDIRKAVTGKTPATAELINWFRILGIDGLLPHIQRAGSYADLSAAHQVALKQSLSVLVKTSEDRDTALKIIDPQHKPQA